MRNWKTTFGGLLLAFGAGGGVAGVPEDYRWIFAVMSAVGASLLGLSAKDYDVHSTVKEVEKSTTKVDGREWGQS